MESGTYRFSYVVAFIRCLYRLYVACTALTAGHFIVEAMSFFKSEMFVMNLLCINCSFDIALCGDVRRFSLFVLRPGN